MESSPRHLARSSSKVSTKSALSRRSSIAENLSLDETISDLMDESNFVHHETQPEAIMKKIDTGDDYIKSLVLKDTWIRKANEF